MIHLLLEAPPNQPQMAQFRLSYCCTALVVSAICVSIFDTCDACQAVTNPGETADAKEWWQTTAFYQIYPRSFKDSNGDGIGDLNGITEKLSYLRDIGIGATWLSPCFKSPMVDFGYDISDFYDIHTEYGTLADFDALIVRAGQVGVKIILDFVPNHTSDQHEWFTKSVAKETGFEDFYIWHPGYLGTDNVRRPPCNWLSIFGGSAWTWSDVRQEYYFHNFYPQQPDLNFRNPVVVDEMKAYSSISIINTYFGNATVEGAQMPFNFVLMSLTPESNAAEYKSSIDFWPQNVPANRTANWVIGNHDNTRVGTRLGVERIDLINIIMQTLPGASVTYYGEEIGMTNVPIVSAENRDPVRSPFQWDDTANAGFSTGPTTWLPVASNYTEVNAKAQLAASRSHLMCYKSLTQLRRTATLRYGDMVTHVIGEVLVLIRIKQGESVYLTVANVGRTYSLVDLKAVFAYLPDHLSYEIVCGTTFQEKGEKVPTDRVPIKANEAFVLSALPMDVKW